MLRGQIEGVERVSSASRGQGLGRAMIERAIKAAPRARAAGSCS